MTHVHALLYRAYCEWEIVWIKMYILPALIYIWHYWFFCHYSFDFSLFIYANKLTYKAIYLFMQMYIADDKCISLFSLYLTNWVSKYCWLKFEQNVSGVWTEIVEWKMYRIVLHASLLIRLRSAPIFKEKCEDFVDSPELTDRPIKYFSICGWLNLKSVGDGRLCTMSTHTLVGVQDYTYVVHNNLRRRKSVWMLVDKSKHG